MLNVKTILNLIKNLSFFNRLIRRNLVIFACDQGVQDCVTKAKNYFTQWMNKEDINEYKLLKE